MEIRDITIPAGCPAQQQPQRLDPSGAGEETRRQQGRHSSAGRAGGAGGEGLQQRTTLQTGDHADGRQWEVKSVEGGEMG